jgi:hypothetical protein
MVGKSKVQNVGIQRIIFSGFTKVVYMDYASELAEIITLIYNKESYTFF